MSIFGGFVGLFAGDAADGSCTTTADEDMDLVRRTLLGFNDGGEGLLRIYRPCPTAAFSPRDTTHARYGEAAEAMRARGFAPTERRAGGQLAIYDEHALVIDLVAPHPSPREDVIARFKAFSGTIANVLTTFGADARVGALAGEYCPGDYSIHASVRRIKLAGVAQRIGRAGFHIGAVISISPSPTACEAVAEAYGILGMPFDPATYGSVADCAPDPDPVRLREALCSQFAK